MTKTGRKSRDRLPEQVLTELAAIGLTRATDVLQIEDGSLSLKSLSRMGKHKGAAIASVENTENGLKIKFYDKLKALELLGSYLGMSGKGVKKREAEQTNLLEAIQASTRGDLSTSDIQELQQPADSGNDMVESVTISGM